LVAAAVFALTVEILGSVGWWRWRLFVGHLRENPTLGAESLAEDPLLRLPSAVRRARRLPGGELARASDEVVVPALQSLSEDQLRWFPADALGYTNRARWQLIEDAVADAAASLDAALERDPTSPRLHRLAALADRAQGLNGAALDHLSTAAGLSKSNRGFVVELTPEEAQWVRLQGLVRRLDYYPRARSEGVIELARELRARGEEELGRGHLAGETADPRVVLELARWDLDAELTTDAEDRLSGLVRRHSLPSAIMADAWALIAVARDQRGDSDGAVTAADIALGYNPTSPAPYRVLAVLAERRGDVDTALAHLRRAWGMNPTDVGLLLTVARTAEKAGQPDDARLALERAVSVDPANPGLRVRLVDFHLRRGDYLQATVALSDALDRFPTDPGLLRLADRLRNEVNRR
jgi:Tfp pilus assembly protein PilF